MTTSEKLFPNGRFYTIGEYGEPDLVGEARDFFNAPHLLAVCDEETGLLAITDPDKAERIVAALEAQRLLPDIIALAKENMGDWLAALETLTADWMQKA